MASRGIRHSSCLHFAALSAGIFLALLAPARANTIYASSVFLVDVSSAVASATDGDTVIIPAGTATWTSTLTITKNITLAGAGSGMTTIMDGLVRTGVLRNLINFTVSKDLPFGLRGITIQQGSESGASTSGVVAVFGGTSGTSNPSIPSISTQLRITDVNFNYPNGGGAVMIRITDAIGVVDHCKFTSQNQFLTVYHPHWMGGTFGNGSWADDPTWGSGRFLFIEDCTVTNNASVIHVSDSDQGARYVVRHCTLNNAATSGHGTEASGRGTKQIEIYNNTFNIGTPTSFPQLRSGSVLMHDNVLNGYSSGMSFEIYRFIDQKQHWGVVTGTNGYDKNATDGPLGGSLYERGMHTGPNNSHTLIDSSKNWSPNKWVGDTFVYVIVNTSRTTSPSDILSNTSNQVTFEVGSFASPNYAPPIYFNTGDSYEIRKVLVALDQVGQGKGDLKSGTDYAPATFPNTVLEPAYSWNNWTDATHTAQMDFHTKQVSVMKEGRDFYNRTPKPGYTPYTYPHPLVNGVPGPPTDLRIVP